MNTLPTPVAVQPAWVTKIWQAAMCCMVVPTSLDNSMVDPVSDPAIG